MEIPGKNKFFPTTLAVSFTPRAHFYNSMSRATARFYFLDVPARRGANNAAVIRERSLTP